MNPILDQKSRDPRKVRRSVAISSTPVATTTTSAGTTMRCAARIAARVVGRSVGADAAAFRMRRSAARAVPPPTTRPARWR